MLRRETQKIKDDTAELQHLIDDMFATMRNANGIGLAANQIGKSLAMTVIDLSDFDDYKDFEPMALINPVITGADGESVFEEGCLSLPGIREDVVRPEKIGVRFLDRYLREFELEADKLMARVIQHEVDHLHGKYFIDYLSPFKLSLLKGKLNRMKKGEMEAEYPLALPSAEKGKKRPLAL